MRGQTLFVHCSTAKGGLCLLMDLPKFVSSMIVLQLLTSQPHPEPCIPTVLAVISARKMSKDPKSLSIASRRAPSIEKSERMRGRSE